MYSAFQLAKKYLDYYISASNGKGHGIHSPFVFQFVTHVLNDNRQYYAYSSIELLREKLLNDNTIIPVEDMGAGSAVHTSSRKSISTITRNTSKSKKLGQLLHRIANYFQPETILELGTSMGISTAYLSTGNPAANVISCEGSETVANFAAKNFLGLSLDNIKIVRGNFDNALPGILSNLDHIDLVFLDGNHRLEPTLKYFNLILPKLNETSAVIFDDIHWSHEMETAWESIKSDPAVMVTIDLFFLGIVFFRPEFKQKQHFTIRF